MDALARAGTGAAEARTVEALSFVYTVAGHLVLQDIAEREQADAGYGDQCGNDDVLTHALTALLERGSRVSMNHVNLRDSKQMDLWSMRALARCEMQRSALQVRCGANI